MILVSVILELHDRSLRDTGGGVRDIGTLESAIARPFQTFGGEDLYPTAIEKAAALAESLIIINHPFVNGNKRTGFLAMATLLKEYGFTLNASNDEVYETVVAIASCQKPYEEVVAWLKENTVQKA